MMAYLWRKKAEEFWTADCTDLRRSRGFFCIYQRPSACPACRACPVQSLPISLGLNPFPCLTWWNCPSTMFAGIEAAERLVWSTMP